MIKLKPQRKMKTQSNNNKKKFILHKKLNMKKLSQKINNNKMMKLISKVNIVLVKIIKS